MYGKTIKVIQNSVRLIG